MTTFRKNNREFSEQLFKNAAQQNSTGVIGSELVQEFLIDQTGKIIPVKFEFTGLQIDQNGLPVVQKTRVQLIQSCGHRACSLEQVLGTCSYNHTVCTRCQLYTCTICGDKLCDKDVLWLEDDSAFCPEHEKDILIANVGYGALKIVGNTLKYLCGWDGDE